MSATGGHYTADVLLQDGHTWLNLDDTKLKWIDSEQVVVSNDDTKVDHPVNGEESRNNKNKVAYILLYKIMRR
jgi:ubiquitin carboxyl-terminal hydrolase 10